jgi:murein DD-endopeptidase MepM/ murein hydrolase activator NlpD
MTVSAAVSSSWFNAGWRGKLRDAFKPRDIFLHDGTNLRRFRIGTGVQLAAVFAAFVLLAWSTFATVQAVAAMNGDVAVMQRQVASMEADLATMHRTVERRAAQLERRQAFLAAILSGAADAGDLAALLPAAMVTPQNAAAQAIAAPFAEVEGMQASLAAQARAATLQRYQRAAAEVRRLGLNPARFHQASATGAMGGPYEPVTAASNADPDYRALFMSWRRLDQLEHGVVAIPTGHPVNTANFTSGFGVRSDPFRRHAAMHAGVDLAGPMGTPVYATADGIVERSEYNRGGYGNLIEINHGEGIETRYGHLSRRIAQAGQRVHRGDLIGLMGSTGRSTGSHLHYEVRIDGHAVNPIPFLEQSQMLVAMQRGNDAGHAPLAIGGPVGGSR